MNRASIYLVERTGSMLQTIKFFDSQSFGMNQNDKRIIFLSQLDFWDFEMDSLMYLFNTFNERQKSWEDAPIVSSKILKQNLLIKRKYLNDFNFNLSKRWNPFRGKTIKVVAPVDLLQETITAWNKLVKNCEYLLLGEKELTSAENAGCKLLKNLNSYLKEIK